MATILIIDDERMVRAVMVRAIRGAGHDTLEAEDGKQGVALAKSGRPDLVITDISMPNQEGIQTINELRELDDALPIIVVSGEAPAHGYRPLDDARLLGADSAFAKPFSLAALVAEVERLLDAKTR
jgi:CheY-like chemotaxis protein